MFHAAANLDLLRKKNKEKKIERLAVKTINGGRRKKFDQMHFIPSILSSLATLEVPGCTKSPLA